MPKEILMPALTPTMETGTLAQWLVRQGDPVTAGQVIAEIETDKSVLEFESLHDGTVGELRVESGTEDIPVDSVIAVLLESGEEPVADPAEPAQPEGDAAASEASVQPTPSAAPALQRSGKVPSSPAARRLATEAGLDISDIAGSGPRGRVVAQDVRDAIAASRRTDTTTPAATPAAESAAGNAPYEERKLTTLLKTMAQRMCESKATIPHLYCSMDVNVDALMGIRKDINETATEAKTTLNDYIVRATALALREVPAMNVQFNGASVRRFHRADISIAVAIKDGLVTPVLRAAENKSVLQISAEARNLAERARDRKLLPEDYEGGTFTVSNVGMFGLKQSWPIINPPQAGIIGIGRASQQPVIVDGEFAAATMMTITLSADHRVVDGAVVGEFLRTLRDYLEHPARLLI